MNWKDMTVLIILILTVFGLFSFMVGQRQMTERAYISGGYIEAPYTSTSRAWTKPPAQTLNNQAIQAINALVKRVNVIEQKETKDVGRKGR